MGSLSSRETSPLPSSTGDAGEPPYVPLVFLYWQLGFWICGLWIFKSRFVIGGFAIKDVIEGFVIGFSISFNLLLDVLYMLKLMQKKVRICLRKMKPASVAQNLVFGIEFWSG
jgi:hypothetical protein